MRKFFIDKKSIKENSVIIDGKEAHHIRDVIRLKTGDRFLGFDGSGKTYTLRITESGSIVKADIEKTSLKRLNMPRVLLACAIPRKSKIDDIIEKATELGVSEIIPMVTERAVVKINNKNRDLKQKRWEKIALSASKQCGRGILPKVYEAMNLKNAVKLAEDLGYKKKIIPCLCEGRKYITDALSADIKELAIFIGPEGDFTKAEIDYTKQHDFEAVSLGELVLRVDTACLFTISVVYAKIGRQ